MSIGNKIDGDNWEIKIDSVIEWNEFEKRNGLM